MQVTVQVNLANFCNLRGRQLAMRFGFIPKEETDEEAAARLRKEKRKRPRPSVGENRMQDVIESEDEGPTPSELEEIARFKAEVCARTRFESTFDVSLHWERTIASEADVIVGSTP